MYGRIIAETRLGGFQDAEGRRSPVKRKKIRALQAWKRGDCPFIFPCHSHGSHHSQAMVHAMEYAWGAMVMVPSSLQWIFNAMVGFQGLEQREQSLKLLEKCFRWLELC